MITIRKPETKDFRGDFKDQYGADIAVNSVTITFAPGGIVNATGIPSNPGDYPKSFRLSGVTAGTTQMTYSAKDSAGHLKATTEDITVEAAPELTTVTLVPLN